MTFLKVLRRCIIVAVLTPCLAHASIHRWIQKESTAPLKPHEITAFVGSTLHWSRQNNIDPLLTLAVIHTESRFNHKARSNHGAVGSMQVIPKWHPDEVQGVKLESIDGGIRVGTAVLKKYIVSTKSIRAALVRYSGGSNAYASKVLWTYNSLRTNVALNWEEK